jgi:hypothetical protein
MIDQILRELLGDLLGDARRADGYPARPLEQIAALAILHTGGSPHIRTDELRQRDARLGRPGIGIHFVISARGRIWYVGDVATSRACVFGHDPTVIGVALAGQFNYAPPPLAQQEAARRLVDALQLALGRSLPVRAARDFAGVTTDSPGRTAAQWLPALSSH